MIFEEWLEEFHPAHSPYDFNTLSEYDKWKYELKVAYEAGREQGYDECYKEHNLGFFSKP